MSEEVNINIFTQDVGQLLESSVSYVPVTVAADMPTQQVHWGEMPVDSIPDSGGTTPALHHVNPTVLQIVNMSDNSSLQHVSQTYQVLPTNTEIMAIADNPGITEDYPSASDLLSLTQSSPTDQDEAAPDLTADIQSVASSADTDSFLTEVISRPLKVFRDVTAVLSEEILTAIPGCQSVVLETLQSDFGVQFLTGQTDQGLQEIHVSGDLTSLGRVKHRLESVCGIIEEDKIGQYEAPGLEHPDIVTPEKPPPAPAPPIIQPETEEKGVSCELLLPTVSQRGRVIKPHSKYTNYLRIKPWLDDYDEEPAERSKRKGGVPRRIAAQQGSPMKKAKSLDDTCSRSAEVPGGISQSGWSTGNDIEEGVHEDVARAAESEDSTPLTSVMKSEAEAEVDIIDPSLSCTKAKTKKDYERLAPFKFFCKKCSFRTKRQSHFMNHKRLHDKQLELYRCRKCNFSSLRLSHLRRHESSHSAQTYKCSQCHYHTDQPKLLQRHNKSKHNSQKQDARAAEVLSCPRCKYTTTRHFHYQRHLRTHPELVENTPGDARAAEKTFQCDLCAYSTQRKVCLFRHKGNVHSDKRPYLCDLCGKSFKRPDALVQHKIIHVDKELRNYPFKCQDCNKSFRSQAHLSEHLDSHSSQRTHLCHICGAAFKTRSVQRKHMQTIHYNPRSFECSLCQKKFNTKFALNRHTRTHVVDQRADTMTTQVCAPDSQDLMGSEVSVAAEQILVQQVQDVIVPSVNEVYDQSGETIQQTFIQTSDSRPTFLYLSASWADLQGGSGTS